MEVVDGVGAHTDAPATAVVCPPEASSRPLVLQASSLNPTRWPLTTKMPIERAMLACPRKAVIRRGSRWPRLPSQKRSTLRPSLRRSFMCGRILRHVWSYLYIGAKSAKVPRLFQSCEHLASTQPGGLSSAPIRCRMQLQLTAARIHALWTHPISGRVPMAHD